MSFSIGDLFNPVSLIGDLLGGGGNSAGGAGDALGPLGSLFGPIGGLLGAGEGLLGGLFGGSSGGSFGGSSGCGPVGHHHHHHHHHHRPYPFSPGCGEMPPGYFNDPSQLGNSLGSASNKLSNGLDDFSDIGTLQNAADQAQADSKADPKNQTKALQAQEALEQLQLAVEQRSNEINIMGEMAKKAIDNSKLQ